MHRTALLSLLTQYHPATQQEETSKKQILEFITAHPNCFERSLLAGHITASAWLINHDHTKALLMHHTKLDKWIQPGGHCDGNPDTLAVALTEAQEESGLSCIVPVMSSIFDLDIHAIPAHKGVPAHIHYDIRFLLCSTKDEPLRINSESKGFCWVSKYHPLLATTEQSVVRMFEKWRSYPSL